MTSEKQILISDLMYEWIFNLLQGIKTDKQVMFNMDSLILLIIHLKLSL